jgi:L-Lysine epsilon oxidase N-terminal/L-lysine epsilon oxidase C-terminal domain
MNDSGANGTTSRLRSSRAPPYARGSSTSPREAALENYPPPTPPPPCGCDDPIAGLKALFVDVFQSGALKRGRDPATRPVFLRLHGVAHGEFIVRDDLPPHLRVGLFAQTRRCPVWVRFSSDLQPGAPDLKGTIGIAMKLFAADGRSHDVILQNHDVFFVDTAKDMCEFTCLSLNGRADEYIQAHPVTGRILKDMEKVVGSVLASPYWSVLPYRFGADRYVKYKLEPETLPPTGQPDLNDPFYLRADLQARLRQHEARFKFMIQFRTDDEKMPLDRATVRWSETESVPTHVATLVLPAQDLGMRGQNSYGENLAFNPGNTLDAHAPVGSLGDARRVVYAASAANRHNVNGVPDGEPAAPRPPEWAAGVPYPPARDTRVVRAAIHPAIGVARLGNSHQEFFIGPQIVPSPSPPLGAYRDAQGALKRQAVQFRIYGYNAGGEVVAELTADTADIAWTAHVANTKAAWYQWEMALDVPEAANKSVPLRNAAVGDRQRLVIDGGEKTIAGKDTAGAAHEFRGRFMDTDVYLGELRTDDKGRLVFLGGRGVSASPTGSPIFNTTDPNAFINADGWYDDICDGPVTAVVNIEGRAIPVEPAWVTSAPPNYAPDVIGVRTLYDLLVDLYVGAGWLPRVTTPSFQRDVYPILRRLSGLQWVNQGFATQFGPGGPHDFENAEYVAQLARDPNQDGFDRFRELRQQVLLSFRPPDPADGNQLPWPWLYGDAMEVPAIGSPRQNAAISVTQYNILRAWAKGAFVPDVQAPGAMADRVDALPLAQRPAMLDRAALEHCLADAFHPGCEVTWPVRHLTIYAKPFRIRHRSAGAPSPSFGPTLTQAKVLGRDGPLHEQGPGDLTRWMGLPWQADTAFCRSGYDRKYDLYQPTFWPARVPNQVLTEADYLVAVDQELPRPRRIQAFLHRTDWNAPLQGDTAGQMEHMVRIFGSMGLLERREGVTGDPDLPPQMLVATFGPDVPPPVPPPPIEAVLLEEPGAAEARDAANFSSDEEARQAPLPVRHTR